MKSYSQFLYKETPAVEMTNLLRIDSLVYSMKNIMGEESGLYLENTPRHCRLFKESKN